MKRFSYPLVFLLFSLFFLPRLSLADQWQVVGPRALSMGGAHVAVVNDATAQYWNPAAFGFFGRQAGEWNDTDEHSDKDFGMHIHGGLGYQSHEDTVKEIDDVTSIDYSAIQADINGTDGTAGLSNINNIDDYIKLIGELEDLNKANIGVSALGDASINMRIRNWGVGVIGLVDVSAIPVMDLVNINPDSGNMITELSSLPRNDTTPDVFSTTEFNNLVASIAALNGWDTTTATNMVASLDDALLIEGYTEVPPGYIDSAYDTAVLASTSAGGGSFANNSSLIAFRGISITEVPVTYGLAFNDNFSMGVNLKAMKATTYYYSKKIYNSDAEDLFDGIDTNSEESSDIGLDVGALYKAGPVRLGIVARNVNKPTFDARPEDYEVDPQVRAGAALRLWNRLTLAADMDLTENDTNISEDYKSRNLAIGAEVDLMFLSLRAGGYRNLAESDIGIVYTAGLGVDFYAFQLDAGVAWSKEKAEIEGEDIREEARGELALSFQF